MSATGADGTTGGAGTTRGDAVGDGDGGRSHGRLAVLGCGYVANMYLASMPRHPELRVVSVADSDSERARTFAGHCPGDVAVAGSIEELLAGPEFDIALNLTNPSAHGELNRTLLEAGRHVYCEKPLSMDRHEARDLRELAERQGLMLTSAPCTLMSPCAQTLWKTVEAGAVGTPRLVLAEMDDGMVHRMPLERWRNEMGVVWPARDEFRTGCTIEHAGYVLTWLVAMFGPVEELTSFAASIVPEKLPGEAVDTPDFTVAGLKHASGVVTRLTNGIYAERDHRLRVFGDEGVIDVHDPRCDDSNVRVRKYVRIRRGRRLLPFGRKVPLVGDRLGRVGYRGSQRRDFCRAIADMAASAREGRRPYLDSDLALHVTEVSLAIQQSAGETYRPFSTCASPGRQGVSR